MARRGGNRSRNWRVVVGESALRVGTVAAKYFCKRSTPSKTVGGEIGFCPDRSGFSCKDGVSLGGDGPDIIRRCDSRYIKADD